MGIALAEKALSYLVPRYRRLTLQVSTLPNYDIVYD